MSPGACGPHQQKEFNQNAFSSSLQQRPILLSLHRKVTVGIGKRTRVEIPLRAFSCGNPLERIVAFSDTCSWFSIGNARQLKLFEVEVRSILEGQRPQRVHVFYFDVTVHKVETYEAVFPPILAHFSWIRRIRKFLGFSSLV